MPEQWFYAQDKKKCGPISLEQLCELIAQQKLTPQSLVWKTGMTGWTAASDVCEISGTAPPIPNTPTPVISSPASRGAPASVPLLASLIGLCVSIALTALTALLRSSALTLVSLFFVIATLVSSITFFAIFVHGAWDCIPSVHQRTTPAKAAGFLFIPFFNLVWIFTAIRGLAIATNAVLQERQCKINVDVGAATALCIVSVVATLLIWIPGVDLLVLTATAVFCARWLYDQGRATEKIVTGVDTIARPTALLYSVYGAAAVAIPLAFMLLGVHIQNRLAVPRDNENSRIELNEPFCSSKTASVLKSTRRLG